MLLANPSVPDSDDRVPMGTGVSEEGDVEEVVVSVRVNDEDDDWDVRKFTDASVQLTPVFPIEGTGDDEKQNTPRTLGILE